MTSQQKKRKKQKKENDAIEVINNFDDDVNIETGRVIYNFMKICEEIDNNKTKRRSN